MKNNKFNLSVLSYNPYNIPISLYDNDKYNINNLIYHEHRNNIIFKERWINNILFGINLFITKCST